MGAYRDAAGSWVSAKYREGCPVPEGAETAIWERRVFFCVPVPGEAPWAQPVAEVAPPGAPGGLGDGLGGGKRRLGGEGEEAMEAEEATAAVTTGEAPAGGDPKRPRPGSAFAPSPLDAAAEPPMPAPAARGFLLKARRAVPLPATPR